MLKEIFEKIDEDTIRTCIHVNQVSHVSGFFNNIDINNNIFSSIVNQIDLDEKNIRIFKNGIN